MKRINKPANYDNSWLGITGITIATLYDANNKPLGTCLDTPNNVAYARAINDKVSKAIGMLGEYDMKDINSRLWFVVKEAEAHKKYIKFNR